MDETFPSYMWVWVNSPIFYTNDSSHAEQERSSYTLKATPLITIWMQRGVSLGLDYLDTNRKQTFKNLWNFDFFLFFVKFLILMIYFDTQRNTDTHSDIPRGQVSVVVIFNCIQTDDVLQTSATYAVIMQQCAFTLHQYAVSIQQYAVTIQQCAVTIQQCGDLLTA